MMLNGYMGRKAALHQLSPLQQVSTQVSYFPGLMAKSICWLSLPEVGSSKECDFRFLRPPVDHMSGYRRNM